MDKHYSVAEDCIENTKEIEVGESVEKKLKENQNILNSIINTSLDIICTSDTKGNIVEFNKAAELSFGYEQGEIQSTPVIDIYGSTKDYLNVSTSLNDKGVFAGEILNKRKNGETFSTFLSATVLFDEDGKRIGTMGVSRTLTALEKSTNQLIDSLTEKKVLSKRVAIKYNFSKSIIGNSKPIKSIFNLLSKAVENNNITVSISGETGTGKELIAKAIHYNSKRKSEPFIPVNVTAIPSQLIESKLFGHERGSFTGAESTRKGIFEEAGNGTIFLDEIGEMDLHLQSRLLRVLQEMEVVRVGGNHPIKLNCRVIIATHKNLIEEVKKGTFRQDLYYRILGLPIQLPPLRERKEDILLLANHFLHGDDAATKKTISDGAEEKLLKYSFPGNVRELKAIMELAEVLSDNQLIEPESVIFPVMDNLSDDMLDEELSMKEYELKIIQFYLHKFNNNISKSSDILKIGKSTIYRILKENKN